MYDSNAAITALQLAFSDTGFVIFFVITILLGGVAALVGLGFGVHKLVRYITGNAPGTFGYDSSMGSGESYYHPRKNIRSSSGSINLLN